MRGIVAGILLALVAGFPLSSPGAQEKGVPAGPTPEEVGIEARRRLSGWRSSGAPRRNCGSVQRM